MTSRRFFITSCLCYCSVCFGLFEKLEYLLLILNFDYRWLIVQSLIYLSHFICWIKQVSYLVYIYFLERYLNFILLANNLVECSWNDTFCFFLFQWACICTHRVCFATSSLTIWKNAYVVAIKEGLDKVLNLIIYVILILGCTKDMIEEKHMLLWLFSIFTYNLNFNLFIIMNFCLIF